MIFSKNWLEKYFPKGLPEAERVAEAINLHAFEIDKIEKTGDDYILDVDILPDRAPYASSHRAMAQEISAIANLPIDIKEAKQVVIDKNLPVPQVEIENKKDCLRYMAQFVSGVKISKSPIEIKKLLETIGERSISNIVDATNYCLFDVGQPLHAFDADKVVGKISVRRAKEGEKITTLDNKEIILDKTILVIADQKGPIALAGIKGGKRAEIDENTKNIILESANFNSVLIRKTAQALNLTTSASKRFESGLSAVYAELGLREVSSLISEMLPEANFSEIVDLGWKPVKNKTIKINKNFIAEILGVEISTDQIEQIFKRLNLSVERDKKDFKVTIPPKRTDLNLPEDLVEEVGRIIGYGAIKPILPKPLKTRPLPNRQFSAIEKIRRVLVDYNYFDSKLYTFTDKGVVEILHPLASDKNFLRDNLSEGLLKVAELNAKQAPLLGLGEIKQFEIGQVFTENGERTHLAIVTLQVEGKRKSNYGMEEITNVFHELEEVLKNNLKLKVSAGQGFYLVEADITDSIDRFLAPYSYHDLGLEYASKNKFTKISVYPFVLRDIAVFVPADIEPGFIVDIVKNLAGNLLKRADLFDVFEKEIFGQKKKSLAFHLVFQSDEKTLTDKEINEIMEKITDELNAQRGFEVR